MATLIPEPLSVNPLTADWQAQLLKDTKTAGGAIETCRLTNWDNTAEPLVAKGSRFEINGSYYEVAPDDEAITGWAGISVGATAYVYATPGSGSASFSYSSTVPTWDSAKGGWYNGTARALFRLTKTSATVYSNKCLQKNGKTSELVDEIIARLAEVQQERVDRANAVSGEAAARLAADALLAPKASPALTGNPTAPTQSTSNNSTRLATTAFVHNVVDVEAGDKIAAMKTTEGIGSYAFATWMGGGNLDPGDTTSGDNLRWSNAGGNFSVVIGGGTWRCMGYARAYDAESTADSTTLFVRIS
jgi:hypothetical protein